jgi:hypothetical protein
MADMRRDDAWLRYEGDQPTIDDLPSRPIPDCSAAGCTGPAEISALEAEVDLLRGLYENAVGNRERFGWTINHLRECEEALRCVEQEAERFRADLARIPVGTLSKHKTARWTGRHWKEITG